MSSPSVVVTDLSFSWPDGRAVFRGLDLSFAAHRTGIVGSNGSGKSTLLQLISGRCSASSGTVSVNGSLAYLPQTESGNPRDTVADRLGITAVRSALHRIERGDADPGDVDTVGADWDVEERALALLASVRLASLATDATDLDRAVGTLSGGEATALGLAARLVRQPSVLLLDEPTENLDATARAALRRTLETFPGAVLVASHDTALLDDMDQIVEIRSVRDAPAEVRVFGGNFSHYREVVDAEQDAALTAVTSAEQDLRRQRRELADAHTTLARRRRAGEKAAREKRVPKIVAGGRRSAAQESAGAYRVGHERRVARARERVDDARDSLRDDADIVVDLPDTAVHTHRRVADTGDVTLDLGGRHPGRVVRLSIIGPERVALVGNNGIGKTMLLRSLVSEVPAARLPQGLAVFDEDATVVENVVVAAPGTPITEVRTRLARFLFRGRRADATVRTLSGGERVRAALAMALLADPPPQLLVLDEPTDNLDVASKDHLASAIRSFRGALVVVSHDEPFLDDIGVTRRLELTDTGLARVDTAAEPT